MTELIFLGTGSSLENLTQRNTGGFILKTLGCQIHFDPGPGAALAAQRLNVNTKNTDMIIISKEEQIRNNETNIITKISNKEIQIINQESKKLNVIGNTKIEKTNYAYKIISTNFTLLYIFEPITKEKIKKEKITADVLVIYNKQLEKTKGEISMDDSRKIISTIKPKLTILTGFGEKFKGDKAIEETRELKKKTNSQIVAADDGLQVDLVSYSALSSQKKIFSFD